VRSVTPAPFVYVPPSWADWGWLFLCGLCGGLGQLCIIGAFRAAPAVVVAPFQYTQMLWGTAYGYLIWSYRPDQWVMLGAGIVVASGLYILHRETRRHPSVSTAAKGAPGVGAPLLPPE
jgi:drug/metabolite transporter (DMT)-like permease